MTPKPPLKHALSALVATFLLQTVSYAWEVAEPVKSHSHAENKLIVKFYKDPVRAKKEAQEHGCTAFSRKDESGAVVICGRTVNSTMVIASMEER